MELPRNKQAELDALAAQFLGQFDDEPTENPYHFSLSDTEEKNGEVNLAEKAETIEKMLMEVNMTRDELREVLEWVLGINVELEISEQGIAVATDDGETPKPLAEVLEAAGAEVMEQFLEIINEKLTDKATGEREKLHEGLLQLRQMSHDTELTGDDIGESGGKATRFNAAQNRKKMKAWQRLRRRLMQMRRGGSSKKRDRDKDKDEDGQYASANDARDKDGDGKVTADEELENQRAEPVREKAQALQKTKSYISRIEHMKDAFMGLKNVMQAAKNQKMALQKDRENFDKIFKKGDKESQRNLKILQSAQDANLQQLKSQKTPGMEERAKQGLARGQGSGGENKA